MSVAEASNYSVPIPANPSIPDELVEADTLDGWIERESDGDPVVAHVRITGDECSYSDFSLLELSSSRVERCSYAGCDFSRAMIADVVFLGCDFSNCDFSEANFTRCAFASCKFMGAQFTEAVLHRVLVRDSTMSYASFAKAKLQDFDAHTSDFSHADIAEARFKRVAFDDVRFVGTSFFRTGLSGVDFTTCQLADIVLCDDMSELRGCRMDLYQAAGIAQRLGVEIKD